jgi:hypothetical protein
MTPLFRVVIVALFTASMAASANAQTTGSEPPVSVRGAALIGYEHFTASDTFTGIFGTPGGAVYGGGGEVIVNSRFFVRVDATRFNKTGQRAFDLNGQVFGLGIPLTVTIVPVTFTGGYRDRLNSHVGWYAGGGAGTWSYTETSSGGDAAENITLRAGGYLLLGGVEYRVNRWIGVGFEGQYARVPNAIGKNGLSADLGEHDLGGGSAMLRFVIGQ